MDFDAAGGYHVLGHAIGRSSPLRVPKLLELVTVLVCCQIADAGDPAGQSPAPDGGNYFGGNETMVDTVKEMQIEVDGPNTSWTKDQCAGRTGQVGRIGRAGWTGGARGAGRTGKRCTDWEELDGLDELEDLDGRRNRQAGRTGRAGRIGRIGGAG